MSVYSIGAVDVHDQQKYAEYVSEAQKLLVKRDVEILAYSKPSVVEGDFNAERVAIMKFKDKAAFEDFFNSPEYRSIVGIRHENSDTKCVFIVDDSESIEM